MNLSRTLLDETGNEFFWGLQLSRDGASLVDFSSEKGKALLCYLAVTRQTHSRAALAGLLWPESPEENARASLRRTLTGMSTTHGFAYWLSSAAILRGWALVEQGQVEKGLVHLRQGLADIQTIGAMYLMPYFLALLSDACQKAGQVDEGLALLTEALTTVNRTKEHHYEAELYRLNGELLLQANGKKQNDQLLPEDCFFKAIEIARQQRARSLELRAVTSLTRLLIKRGKKDEARQMLTEIYVLFKEGFDTADLKEAKTLLEELT